MSHLTILMPVLWYDETPGGWTYFKEIANHLAESNINVIVVSPRANNHKRVEKFKGISVYRYYSLYFPEIPLLLIDPVDYLRVLNQIRRNEPCISLIYDVTSGLLPVSPIAKLYQRLFRAKTPIVTSVLGELKEMKSKNFLSIIFEIYMQVTARLTYYNSNKILIAGEKIAPRVIGLGALPKKLDVAKVGLKYNSKLLNSNTADSQSKSNLRHSIGIAESDFVIGFVGRLSIGKGLDVLLTSVSTIKPKLRQVKILIVGDGGEKAQLELLSRKLGIADITIFLGHREDVPDLLQLMDIFVNLSKSEAGISGAQLEAMQCGLPSVITPFTDFLEDKKQVLMVPFGNVQAVSDAILLLATDAALRESLSQNSLLRAKELMNSYTWDGFVEKVMTTFKTSLGVKP